jgi:hypothetical protein
LKSLPQKLRCATAVLAVDSLENNASQHDVGKIKQRDIPLEQEE